MDFEEDTYSSIFLALKHPVRRKILRMLDESPANYTEILKELGVETGFLNYHLDSLKGLVTKNRDGRYSLSDFGEAALDLTKRVEEPVRRESIELRLIGFKVGPTYAKASIAILLIGIILISGLYIDLFYQLKEQGVELEKQAEELEVLTARYDRLAGFSELVNLTLKQPAITKFVGIFVVSGYYLECGSTGIEPEFKLGSAYYGRDIAIIYSPLDNLTLKLSLQITSESGLYVPLTVQYGDVFRLEFGVPIAVWNETIIEWQAPILWSIDANETGVYEVLLPSKGWHTISLVGPISTHRGGVSHGGIGIKWENGLRLIERFNIRLEFKVLKNGEPILFAVRPLRWL